MFVCRCLAFCTALQATMLAGLLSAQEDDRSTVTAFIEKNCLDCHDAATAEGGLDLERLELKFAGPEVFDRWVLIHDRIRDGEMPPPADDVPRPVAEIGWSSQENATPPSTDDAEIASTREALRSLGSLLWEHDRARTDREGRAKVRRLNRLEYENTLRAVLAAPWLQVADSLPEDGVDHLFNKVGERLDVSHVQLTRYLAAAERSIRLAVNAAGFPSETRKFYAREEPTPQHYVHYRFGQTAATRSIVPLVDLTPEVEVIRKNQPITVGTADPQKREREAMGVFSGVYSATTKYDFTRIDTPTDGHYRLRFKTYTFKAGPNGASGGDDHGLTGGNRAWWRPDRNVIQRGSRSEPVTLYALAESGDSRWLTTFDSHPDPDVFECVVALREGEDLRPDAARLVRTRPGWKGNPNATEEGVPGFAMNWLEVEGPLHDQWPPASYRALFGDLPFEVDEQGDVKAIVTGMEPSGPAQNGPESEVARRVLARFHKRCFPYDRSEVVGVEPFMRIFANSRRLNHDFTESIIAATSAMLCCPDFLYLDSRPGRLGGQQLHQRLAYFLWNGPPDGDIGPTSGTQPLSDEELASVVERMLDDPRSERFVNAFLDYWLDLRDINANTPDASLYPDYYLDELLTESSVRATRMFFRELIDTNAPVRTLIDADFVFANERLAEHYGLEAAEGVQPRRINLPDASPRGGLLTESSLLRVTANGTTTSPVIRGAWIAERILGIEVPPPPSGVDAVEPDTRGATTIREQLERHRSTSTCNACHARFDPIGFALESFDVAGGWRTRYRAIGDQGQSVDGIGKNGHLFEFKLAQPVDCSGTLRSGEPFDDIYQLKSLLAAKERQLARNLVQRLVVYAAGAPVTFGDRAEIELILDNAATDDYGIRSLLHEVVRSRLFQFK